MTPDVAATLASLVALVVTILGWYFTRNEQAKLARIQADLQKGLFEHDTRFQYLYTQRAKVMDKLYKKVDRIISLLQASERRGRFEGERSPDEQRSDVIPLLSELQEYYYQNRLYLDRTLRDHMESFLKPLMLALIDFGVASQVPTDIAEQDPNVAKERNKLYEDASKQIGELTDISEVIEEQMRRILGIDAHNPAS